MKVIVSGGRTGGHLIPGIAVYEELRKRKTGLLYIMSEFDLKFPVVSRVAKNERVTLELTGLSRKLSLKTPLYIMKILGAFFHIFGLIRKFRPDAVLITGGYISNPVALASLILRIPLFIAEQNSVAGITNRFYAPFARIIFTSFPDTLKIPAGKARLTGNPSIYRGRTVKKDAMKFFGLGKEVRHVVGVSGGSQGSLKVNDAVFGMLDQFLKNRVGVIWSLGSVDYERFSREGRLKVIDRDYPNVKVFRFIERMDHFLSCTDCVVSRSGATSLSEYIQFGVPGVLIPIRNSPDNHQYLNASFLEKNGCALIVQENELNLDKLQKAVLDVLKRNPAFRKSLTKLKKDLYSANPAELIADVIIRSMAY